MKKLIILLSLFCLSMSTRATSDFTRSDTNQEFCKDIVYNLVGVGVRVPQKLMTKSALQVLGGASATLQCSYGSPVNKIVKSNPYRMFVTRGDNEIGTCYVLHPRKTRRKMEKRDC